MVCHESAAALLAGQYVVFDQLRNCLANGALTDAQFLCQLDFTGNEFAGLPPTISQIFDKQLFICMHSGLEPLAFDSTSLYASGEMPVRLNGQTALETPDDSHV